LEGGDSASENGNGLSAETLLRTLFETVTSTTILAKHPEKLGDFIDHGRLVELRMMRVIESPALKERLQATIKATDTGSISGFPTTQSRLQRNRTEFMTKSKKYARISRYCP